MTLESSKEVVKEEENSARTKWLQFFENSITHNLLESQCFNCWRIICLNHMLCLKWHHGKKKNEIQPRSFLMLQSGIRIAQPWSKTAIHEFIFSSFEIWIVLGYGIRQLSAASYHPSSPGRTEEGITYQCCQTEAMLRGQWWTLALVYQASVWWALDKEKK